ncbi:hypothetical protein ACFL5X_03290 [Candidatus Omnitrophota bacterium]
MSRNKKSLFDPYERIVLIVLVIVNTCMPMKIMLKLNTWFTFFMAKNPMHGFARGTATMLKESQCKKKRR